MVEEQRSDYELADRVARGEYFFIGEDFSARDPLRILYGGWEICCADYRIRRRDFPFYCLELVLTGQGDLRLGEERFRLGVGSCFLYAPGMSWEMAARGDDGMKKHFILFDGAKVPALLEAAGLRGGECFEVEAPAATAVLYEAVRREAARRSARRPGVCVALLRALLMQVGASRLEEGGDSLPHRRFEKILELMERSFLELRTAEEIARRADVEVSYLCRLFKRYHDCPPYRHLQRLRMNHALALLANPGMTVSRVAESLGYESPFHFSRVFKSVHGLPPKHFRG